MSIDHHHAMPSDLSSLGTSLMPCETGVFHVSLSSEHVMSLQPAQRAARAFGGRAATCCSQERFSFRRRWWQPERRKTSDSGWSPPCSQRHGRSTSMDDAAVPFGGVGGRITSWMPGG